MTTKMSLNCPIIDKASRWMMIRSSCSKMLCRERRNSRSLTWRRLVGEKITTTTTTAISNNQVLQIVKAAIMMKRRTTIVGGKMMILMEKTCLKLRLKTVVNKEWLLMIKMRPHKSKNKTWMIKIRLRNQSISLKLHRVKLRYQKNSKQKIKVNKKIRQKSKY